MHLFEAMIALFDATKDIAFQTRSGDFFQLLCTHFYDPRTKLLGEYFEDDWSRISPVAIEPGHQAEWVWLLKAFERITGCPTGKQRTGLLASAMRYRDPQTGCLIDEGREDGSVAKSSRRCWPQTECAKAWIAQVESGEADGRDEAVAALARLEEHYLRHPVRGGWYDQFDERGRSIVDFIPASSFYHILVAIAEADRVLG
jgi:mannose-6-phosphate isomerase